MTDACVACGLKESPYLDANGLCPMCSPLFDGGNLPEWAETMPESAVNGSNTDGMNNSTMTVQIRAQSVVAKHGGIRPAARAIGKELGMKVNPGIIGLALKGEDFPKARRVLGLPQKTVEVEPCPDCGKVHTRLKQCDEERSTRTRHRVALEVDTPDEAAALRALLARYGSRRQVARALVTGELRIVENGG